MNNLPNIVCRTVAGTQLVEHLVAYWRMGFGLWSQRWSWWGFAGMVTQLLSASHVKSKVLVRWPCQDGRSGEDWHSRRPVACLRTLSCNTFHSRPLRERPLHQHQQSPELRKWGTQSIISLQTFNILKRQARTSTSRASVALEARQRKCVRVCKLLERPAFLVKYFWFFDTLWCLLMSCQRLKRSDRRSSTWTPSILRPSELPHFAMS